MLAEYEISELEELRDRLQGMLNNPNEEGGQMVGADGTRSDGAGNRWRTEDARDVLKRVRRQLSNMQSTDDGAVHQESRSFQLERSRRVQGN